MSEDGPRWTFDIAQYTNDLDKATEALNVFDRRSEQERIPREQWVPARPGFNKRYKSIVIALPTWSMLQRFQPFGTFNAFRFGPLLTSFLAAMAPNQPNRIHVIRYAVNELKLFELDTNARNEACMPERLREWYAFHTLRRMYRFRWGVSLFEQPEQSGKLDAVKLTQDVAYQYYRDKATKAMKELRKEVEAEQ